MKILKKASLGFCAVAVPIGVAIGGAVPASADHGGGDGLCVSGPFGGVNACVQVPGWAPWYGGPWYGGWHGGGDDQGEDD